MVKKSVKNDKIFIDYIEKKYYHNNRFFNSGSSKGVYV